MPGVNSLGEGQCLGVYSRNRNGPGGNVPLTFQCLHIKGEMFPWPFNVNILLFKYLDSGDSFLNENLKHH